MRNCVLFGRRQFGQGLAMSVRLKATVETESELASWRHDIALDDALQKRRAISDHRLQIMLTNSHLESHKL